MEEYSEAPDSLEQLQDGWLVFLAMMKDELGARRWAFIKDTKPTVIAGGVLTIGALTDFHIDMLNGDDGVAGMVAAGIKRHFGFDLEVRFGGAIVTPIHTAFSESDSDSDWDSDGESEGGKKERRRAGKGKRLKVMDDVDIGEAEFLFNEGRIPMGAVTLLAGDVGLGKSTCTMTVAARVTLEGKDVVVISTEDSWTTTIAPRLIAAGADMSHIQTVVDNRDDEAVGLTFPADIVLFEKMMESVPNLGLIVIDPITAMVDPAKVHTGMDSEVRTYVLDPIGRITRKRNCAAIAVIHPNKREGLSALHRVTGTLGFVASVRSVLMWGITAEHAREDPARFLVHAKCNVGPLAGSLEYAVETLEIPKPDGGSMETSRLRLVGSSGLTADELFSKRAGSKADQREEGMKLLVELWEEAKGAVESKVVHDAAKELGISPNTMLRALTEIGGIVQRKGFGKGALWLPPIGWYEGS